MRIATEQRTLTGRTIALLLITVMATVVAIGYRVQTAAAANEGDFAFAATGTTVMEGNTAYIAINRTSGTTGVQVVNLTVTPNPPATYADIYGYGDGYQTTVTFAQGVSSRTIDVTNPGTGLPTNDDVTNQGVRTISFVISSISGGGAIGAQNTHTLTINDNDGPSKYSFTTASSSVTEGTGAGSHTVNISVTRSGATNDTETVQCIDTLTGTAAPGGNDYSFSTQVLTFTAGETTETCTVSIVRDDDSEPGGKTVILGFGTKGSGDFPGGVGTNPTHTLTIDDDDGSGTARFASTTYTAAESGGTAQFAVERVNGSSGTINATCATADLLSAVPGADYTATPVTSALSWGPGDTATKYCQVAILTDATPEGPETFGLSLTGNVSSPTSATVTIVDDDGTGTLQFTASSYSGAENGGGITVVVTRSGGTTGTVSVDVATTASGSTATAGLDYTAASTTLTFNPGDNSESWTVYPIDDGTVEGTEHFHVFLSDPTGGATLGTPSTTQVFITDNESPLPAISSLSPSSGTILGGTLVTITGVNFSGATSVTFGGFSCTSVNVASANTITCVTPAHVAGTVEVVVTTPSGSNSTTGAANDYTYTGGPTITSLDPATGLAIGNTIVTITGTNFTASGMTVRFDGVVALHSFVDSTTVVAVAPPHSAGVVDVTVTTPGGTSPNTAADDFTYTGASGPVVSSLSPASGPVGTTVTISGSGLTGATLVSFGGVAATFTVNNDAQITASVPSGTPIGTVDVRVTTPSGTSPNTAADNFNNTSAAATVSYTLFFRFTLIVWTGQNNVSALAALTGLETPVDNPNTNNVSGLVGAIWRFDAATQTFKGYFPGSDNVPGANDFTTLQSGVGYFVALLNPGTVTWTALGAQ